MQTIGETTSAILEDDTKMLGELLDRNKDKREPYWVVIAAKPSKVKDSLGRCCIMRHFKSHVSRPPSMVGAIIAEVDNVKGTIRWEINPHDVPIGYEALGLKEEGAQVVETAIPQAYRYN